MIKWLDVGKLVLPSDFCVSYKFLQQPFLFSESCKFNLQTHKKWLGTFFLVKVVNLTFKLTKSD